MTYIWFFSQIYLKLIFQLSIIFRLIKETFGFKVPVETALEKCLIFHSKICEKCRLNTESGVMTPMMLLRCISFIIKSL